MRLLPLFVLISWICSAASAGWAQAPRIDRIDPPGWWTDFPDPMLLVRGEDLNGAHFMLDAKGATLIRSQASENGHWAFLWLRTADAAPQTVWVTARNEKGQARRAFPLAARTHNPNTHRGFSSADVLYLIMTDRFADGDPANNQPGYDRAASRGWHGGDLAGIEQHLDYLQQLGVTAVWTTPIVSNASMPDSYHGYAATDLYAIDPHFGTIESYRHLSDSLHAKGMKLVIDWVPNHIGVQHPWVLDPPAPDWLHGTLQHHNNAEHDFYQLLDPHAPARAWRNITDGWFTDAMPDLNQENPLVSRYLIQNALWWVETADLDGIRLDTFPYVNRAFWHDFHATMHSVYPHLTTVGEIFHRDPEVTSFFAGGATHGGIDTGLDTPFDFPVYFTLRDVLAHGKPMTDLTAVLRQDALYPYPERLVSFIGNHDTVRFLTESGGSVLTLKLGLGMVTTLRGMPQIYSGDEIGMPGGSDPDNRRDFPGGFAGDTHTAFTKAGRTSTEEDVFEWTSGLLALRREHPALQSGIEQNLFADDNVFAQVRAQDGSGCSPGDAKDRLLIVVNKAHLSRAVQLSSEDSALAGCTVFHTATPTVGKAPIVNGATIKIEQPAESMTVFEVR